jgi:hypothetical protein
MVYSDRSTCVKADAYCKQLKEEMAEVRQKKLTVLEI